MHLIDTHCHLSFEKFDADRAEVLNRAHVAGVEKMISVGCTLADARKTFTIAEHEPNIFVAIGIHPADIEANFTDDFSEITKLATLDKVVAIGETGFDFYRPENPARGMQETVFWQHVSLAQQLKKPLIIHSRAAVSETLAALQKLKNQPFVWHCFSENWETAQKVLDLGGMISFPGVVTFAKNQEIQEVARRTPLHQIMVETDAPFLAPEPYRGKRCEPAFVAETAKFIAALRGIDAEEFALKTTENAERFFGI